MFVVAFLLPCVALGLVPSGPVSSYRHHPISVFGSKQEQKKKNGSQHWRNNRCNHWRLFATEEGPNTKREGDVIGRSSDPLEEKFGGYTVKQRLREEVESPFRQVRLLLFGGSAGSALVALYFSALNVLKATSGGNYVDAPSLDDALSSCGINAIAVVVCAALAYRDWKAGEANLERIARGGALARLEVRTMQFSSSATTTTQEVRRSLTEYRRNSRVLLAAGGTDYIINLAKSLASDDHDLPNKLAQSDIVVVPVLLQQQQLQDTNTLLKVGDSAFLCSDQNMDISKALPILAFPRLLDDWTDYLQSEIETATGQGFDVLQKGFTIIVKKNGRILRRATGQPQWLNLIGTMEVMDGSKFGMPGDSERYGGP